MPLRYDLSMMNIAAWMVFGTIAGVIANIVEPKPVSGGLLGAIILGILGASVGGLLADLILGINSSGFNLSSFIIAITGSLLLLFVGKLFKEA